METEEMKKVSLGHTQEIESPHLDVAKYIGRKAKIESVTEFESRFGYCIRCETAPLDTLSFENDSIELKASRIFGLHKNKQGEVGWIKQSLLGQYLTKLGLKHYRELVGREVTIQSITKNGKDFLTFN